MYCTLRILNICCSSFLLTVVQLGYAQEVTASAVPTIKVKRTADEAEGSEQLSALLNLREEPDEADIMVSYDMTSNVYGHTKRERMFDVWKYFSHSFSHHAL